MAPGRGGAARPGERNALDRTELFFEQRVGAVLNPTGDLGLGGTTVGRVVLEAAVAGRVVGRRDDDPVGEIRSAGAIVGEDGMGDDRRRRVALAVVDPDVHLVRREHLEGAGPGGVGERMGVGAEEERAGDGLLSPVVADGLGNGEDVGLVERAIERRAPVA